MDKFEIITVYIFKLNHYGGKNIKILTLNTYFQLKNLLFSEEGYAKSN